MVVSAIESHDYSHLIGTDLTVGDSDNRSFAPYLPRTGTVIRQIALDDWGTDWLVLHLHEPFEYQLGSLETGFRGVVITDFIVRSRLVGYPIGGDRTSVFLLIDPDHVLPKKQEFTSRDFIHICWGMIPPGRLTNRSS
jgi:hypothetical protein